MKNKMLIIVMVILSVLVLGAALIFVGTSNRKNDEIFPSEDTETVVENRPSEDPAISLPEESVTDTTQEPSEEINKVQENLNKYEYDVDTSIEHDNYTENEAINIAIADILKNEGYSEVTVTGYSYNKALEAWQADCVFDNIAMAYVREQNGKTFCTWIDYQQYLIEEQLEAEYENESSDIPVDEPDWKNYPIDVDTSKEAHTPDYTTRTKINCAIEQTKQEYDTDVFEVVSFGWSDEENAYVAKVLVGLQTVHFIEDADGNLYRYFGDL